MSVPPRPPREPFLANVSSKWPGRPPFNMTSVKIGLPSRRRAILGRPPFRKRLRLQNSGWLRDGFKMVSSRPQSGVDVASGRPQDGPTFSRMAQINLNMASRGPWDRSKVASDGRKCIHGDNIILLSSGNIRYVTICPPWAFPMQAY